MLIQNEVEFKTALNVLLRAKSIAIDTETTWGTCWHERRVIGMSTYCEIDDTPYAYYFPFRHESSNSKHFRDVPNLPVEWLPRFAPIFNTVGVNLAFHNAKFDMEVLHRDGLNIVNRFWDTMLMSHMANENGSHALKKLSKLIVSDDADFEEKQLKALAKLFGSWEQIHPSVMEPYACKDVILTYKLARHFFPILQEQGLLTLWPIEEEFCRVLGDIESRGIKISCDTARHLAKEAQEELDAIQEHLGFNPMEPLPLAEYLFKKLGFFPQELTGHKSKSFPLGRPVMSESVLLQFDHPDVRLILRYRGLLKAKSTWLDGWVDVCDPGERIHPTFMQHGTKTTRLSCNSPNMHQIPRDERSSPVDIKSVLRASDGFELWEFDYDQIELRLACAYAKDETMLEAFRTGQDVHQLTANFVGIDRQGGKTLNFAMLYGAGSGKIGQLLGVPLEEAREILEAFHQAYPKLRRLAWDAQTFSEQSMYIKMWDGRRRHFQEAFECHKAFNSIIQGGAASIIKRSMISIYRSYQDMGFKSRMVSTVHDSIWVEVWSSNREVDITRIKVLMEWPTEEFGLPFPVAAKRLA